MMRARTILVLAALAALLGALPARAQFLGYVSPQTVQSTLAPTGTACTGSPQTFVFPNLGQTQHTASLATNSIQTSVMSIDGLDSSGDFYNMSGDQLGPGVDNLTSISASGYYPIMEVTVTCFPAATGSFSLNYSGTSATPTPTSGSSLLGQIDHMLWFRAPANTSVDIVTGIDTPFGNTQGELFFQYTATGPSGSTIAISCLGQANGTTEQTFSPGTGTGMQYFPLAAMPCPVYNAFYVSGGASATTFTLEYVFQPQIPTAPAYAYVGTSTTATEIKNGAGVASAVIVGTPAIGTVSLFDLAPGACTMTPSTNVIAVLTETASGAPLSIGLNNLTFYNGLCAKASAAEGYTVVYQ